MSLSLHGKRNNREKSRRSVIRMHMLIYVLVNASDVDEALELAECAADALCGDGPKPFDYRVNFKEDGQGVAGKDRFGALPYALQVDTERFPCEDKTGLEQINRAMEGNRKAFLDHIKTLREMLAAYTDEELFGGDVFAKARCSDSPMYFRYYCASLGQFQGPNIRLYDQVGTGIRTPRDLEDIMSYRFHWGDKPLWAVPFDVHY